MNAKKVYYYFRIYQHFLEENHLTDDSNSITVDDLINFVEDVISEEDQKRLMKFVVEAY